MAKKKLHECNICGCARKLLIVAKVREQVAPAVWRRHTFKELCLPCLLEATNLRVPGVKGRYDHGFAMACVEESEQEPADK